MPSPDNCATERKDKDGNADFSADGPDTVRTNRNGKKYYALVNRDDHLGGGGMNKCPDAEVIPLTADSGALLDSIDDFQADGYTAGAIAIQWTYYMLSPKWRTAIKNAGLGDGPRMPTQEDRQGRDPDDRRPVQHRLCRCRRQLQQPGQPRARQRRSDLQQHEG